MFLGTVVYALINSAILALMAIGFNLTFGISGVANFAHGAFYMLGESDIIICSEAATFFDPHVTYGMTASFEPMHMLQKESSSQ